MSEIEDKFAEGSVALQELAELYKELSVHYASMEAVVLECATLFAQQQEPSIKVWVKAEIHRSLLTNSAEQINQKLGVIQEIVASIGQIKGKKSEK